MPSRVTPDSNILISALVFGGNPLHLMEMAFSGEVSLFISDAILQETLRVLRDKFGFSEERLALAERYIGACTTRVTASGAIDVVKEDPMIIGFSNAQRRQVANTSLQAISIYCDCAGTERFRLRRFGRSSIKVRRNACDINVAVLLAMRTKTPSSSTP